LEFELHLSDFRHNSSIISFDLKLDSGKQNIYFFHPGYKGQGTVELLTP